MSTILNEFGKEASRDPMIGHEVVRRFKNELAEIRRDATRQGEDLERLNGYPLNGLNGLLQGIGGPGSTPNGRQTIVQPWTLANANSYSPISLNRILLSYSFMTQGIFRTTVCQPVDDAFRGGFKLKSSELDADELKDLERAMRRQQSRMALRKMAKTVGGWVNYNACADLGRSDVSALKHCAYWARLYGGAGLIVNTDQDFRKELDIEAIRPDSPLVFIPADRWELVLSNINIFDYKTPMPYDYYGFPLHVSRVMKIIWNEAPSYIRLRLQGWGMSEMEHCIRSINSFLKFENLIFELLDEAKIDVWKMQGYNSLLISGAGTQKAREAILLTNQLKNFTNAIVMDAGDEYEQKQLGSIFTGLSDAWEQLRLNLCSEVKIPRNKLFGEGQGGFGSGEDSLENYNSIVEGVRETMNPLVVEAAQIRCQQVHGFVPEDMEAEWPSLRVMKQTDMEEVNTKKQARSTDLFSLGLYNGKEASEALRKDGLLPVDTEVLAGKKPVSPDMEMAKFAAAAEKQQGKRRVLGGSPKKKAA